MNKSADHYQVWPEEWSSACGLARHVVIPEIKISRTLNTITKIKNLKLLPSKAFVMRQHIPIPDDELLNCLTKTNVAFPTHYRDTWVMIMAYCTEADTNQSWNLLSLRGTVCTTTQELSGRPHKRRGAPHSRRDASPRRTGWPATRVWEPTRCRHLLHLDVPAIFWFLYKGTWLKDNRHRLASW